MRAKDRERGKGDAKGGWKAVLGGLNVDGVVPSPVKANGRGRGRGVTAVSLYVVLLFHVQTLRLHRPPTPPITREKTRQHQSSEPIEKS